MFESVEAGTDALTDGQTDGRLRFRLAKRNSRRLKCKHKDNLPIHFVLAVAGQLILSGAVALVAKEENTYTITVFSLISSHAH